MVLICLRKALFAYLLPFYVNNNYTLKPAMKENLSLVYDNFHKVKEEIEAKRLHALAEAEDRSLAMAGLSPEIAAIDEELRNTGMLIFRTACDGGDISALRERNLALNKRRRESILSLGYPEDYTEPKYSC